MGRSELPTCIRRYGLVAALAAIAVSAHGVPVTQAHPHKKALSAQTTRHGSATAHAGSARVAHTPVAARHAAAPVARRASGQNFTKAGNPASHKATPAEVGRAAGMKIRNQMDRRAVMRRSMRERQPARLVRSSYTPARPATSTEFSAETMADLTSGETETTPVPDAPTRPGSGAMAVTGTMSGSTHYETVDAQPTRSPTVASPASAPAMAARTVTPQTFRAATVPSESAAMGASATDAAPSINDNAGDGNAAHPSFARHAAAEVANENADSYDIPEDTRLKAETEEASLNIARGRSPLPLRGNRASLERQNERLEAEGLERIEDEDDLAARIANHLLVPVPVGVGLGINGDLPETHKYCRPWTARFLSDLAVAHEAQFHRPLQVSSAVRTVEYQKKLMLVNGNAAPAEGDVVSPHLTGATVDIAKDNLSRAEMAWMRRHLLALEAAGKIDVEEEFLQSCFHITVYKSYVPERRTAPSRTRQAHGSGGPKSKPVDTQVADDAQTQGA
jgi:hypothetical protein